jgi:hypothetical protein
MKHFEMCRAHPCPYVLMAEAYWTLVIIAFLTDFLFGNESEIESEVSLPGCNFLWG